MFIPVRYSSPQATEPPGLIADPLVPFVNPYTEERVPEPRWRDKGMEGARFGAVGFDLWQERHQPLWVDVQVPKDAAPGVYEGTLSVRAQNAERATIPVRLTVWDFALPDGPTHENHFGNFSYMARYYKLDENSEKYRALEDRYIAMMAAHRLNPPLPRRLLPKVAEDGAPLFDEETDRQITEFVERYHVTNIDVPRAPFRDLLTTGRAKAIRYYQWWYAYLQKKGWAERAYLYMLDEPNTKEAYDEVRQLGALVHEAAPRLRRLVVEQPYTQNPDWGTLDEAVDIWCPLFAFLEEAEHQTRAERGRRRMELYGPVPKGAVIPSGLREGQERQSSLLADRLSGPELSDRPVAEPPLRRDGPALLDHRLLEQSAARSLGRSGLPA